MSSADTKTIPDLNKSSHSWSWGRWIIAAVIGAAVFYSLAIFIPRMSLLWGYTGLYQLLYENLSISANWSEFFALVGSFVYAILWVPMCLWTLRALIWKFDVRNILLAFVAWIVIYGHSPLLRALYGSEVCFNQRTGQALKWYVVQPGGEIVLRDSPGYESAGEQRHPATSQICRIIELQKRGIRPSQIDEDPRSVKYFNEVTGQPRVWYYKAADGRIVLFNAEGIHPVVGDPLLPITKVIIVEAQAQAAAKEKQTEDAAKLKATQEADLARNKALRELVDLFATASYPDGVVIVGANSRNIDDASSNATKQFLSALAGNIRKKGLMVDDFRPGVYSAGHVDALMNGNAGILSVVGLAQKMRATLLAAADASCAPTSGVSGLVSCTISVQVRLLKPSGNGWLRQWSEIGVGGTVTQAVIRAVELLIERHPEILDGI